MSLYLAFLFGGALTVGVMSSVSSIGSGEGLIPLYGLMLAGLQLGMSRASPDVRTCDARIDRFTALPNTFDGRELCEVALTVHSTEFDPYRTTTVTFAHIQDRFEVGDDITVVRWDDEYPDVDIPALEHRVHEFGQDSVAPGRHKAPIRLASTLVPRYGQVSRPPRSTRRLALGVAACIASFAIGAACWGAVLSVVGGGQG